jgi:sec-independent protein translocase protein TatB
MSIGELSLIVIVALVAFSPKKLPMLAQHLGTWVGRLNHYKQQVEALWQHQQHQQALKDNIKKALEAETRYQKDSEL